MTVYHSLVAKFVQNANACVDALDFEYAARWYSEAAEQAARAGDCVAVIDLLQNSRLCEDARIMGY